MQYLQPWDDLEDQEEQLRSRVNALTTEQKKNYYRQQAVQLKDPDTYASLNWLCLGGFHHLYLKKYRLFAIEFSCLIIAIIGLCLGFHYAVYLLIAIAIFELPQLFFSQKIARQYNYQVSSELLKKIMS
ncbi:hypothetical protein [Shewanella halifaxensis]|uniref:hypothetical protein n=1 Tax=Shewanella halifaxensis TaxID=271098 RepID=UPI000D58D42A|nr:hypothetical protein [Shewanella halifaxensis]